MKRVILLLFLLPFCLYGQAGVIAVWSGTYAAIPTGWQACDGTNGSPDLREMFVKGAPVGENPNEQRGDTLVTPAATLAYPTPKPTFAGDANTTIPNHVHVEQSNSTTTGSQSAYGYDASTNTSGASGYSTANPTANGAASFTPAGTISWPANPPTYSGTQATVQPNFYTVIFIYCSSPPSTTPPTGIITMWAGLRSAIPSGWSLCDGSGTTPDLKNKFLKGISGTSNAGRTSGDTLYTPDGSIAWPANVPTFAGAGITTVVNHVHVQNVNTSQSAGTGAGWTYDASTATSAASPYSTLNPTTKNADTIYPEGTIAWPASVPTVTESQSTVIPTYYKLCFIQKQ